MKRTVCQMVSGNLSLASSGCTALNGAKIALMILLMLRMLKKHEANQYYKVVEVLAVNEILE